MQREPLSRRGRSRSFSGSVEIQRGNQFTGTANHRNANRELDKFDIAGSEQQGVPELSNNLVAIAAQLTAYNQELQQRTKERDDLQKLLKRLKTEVTNARSLLQKLQWSVDKTANEAIQYKAKLHQAQEENTVLPNEIKKLQKDMEEVMKRKY